MSFVAKENGFFFWSKKNLGSLGAFGWHVSLISYNMVQFLSPWPWHLWRIQATYFAEFPSIWTCLMFSQIRFWLCILAAGIPQKWCWSFLVHPLRRHVALGCFIPGRWSPSLVPVGSASFLHCEVTIYPDGIFKYLVKRYFWDHVNISVSHSHF